MRIETALAKASLTRVEQRDPYKLFHKMTRAQLQALTPSFRWEPILHRARACLPSREINVTQPAFYQRTRNATQRRLLDDLKTYLRWHLVHAKARFLSSAIRKRRFRLLQQDLARHSLPCSRAGSAASRLVDHNLGEALGQVFVEKTFTPETKARTLAMTKEIEAAMADEIESLPWMSPATKKQALLKLHGVTNKIGYPDKWRDYSSVDISRDDFLGNVERAVAFESRRDLRQDRQAGGPHRMADDSAHRERLLRSADERHQLSRRRSAAAALRSQDG